MKLRALSWLLHLANAHPPFARRQEFYALKDRLLRRFGTLVEYDLQHIVDECWGDDGQGNPCGANCWRCRGTRVFRERWIVLERWSLAGRVFHRPTNLVRWPKPEAGSIRIIEGRIRHADVDAHTSREAALWLALIFDRPLFAALLRGCRYSGWQWRPMLALNAIVFTLSLKLSTHRCWCGRRFITWGSGWQICRPCRAERYAPVQGGDDDLPF